MAKLKETLVKTTAIKLAISERIVDAVVTHQFASANSAMDGSNETVELSGFGKFIFRYNKARIKLQHIQGVIDELEAKENKTIKEKTKLTTYIRLLNKLKPIVENVKL